MDGTIVSNLFCMRYTGQCWIQDREHIVSNLCCTQYTGQGWTQNIAPRGNKTKTGFNYFAINLEFSHLLKLHDAGLYKYGHLLLLLLLLLFTGPGGGAGLDILHLPLGFIY